MYIKKTFNSFKGLNEAVVLRNSKFIIGGIEIDKKSINSYVKKVKEETEKDLKSMFSEMEIAEQLVKWAVSEDNINLAPASALLGDSEDLVNDLLEDEDEETVEETESEDETILDEEDDTIETELLDDEESNDLDEVDAEENEEISPVDGEFETPELEESNDEDDLEEDNDLPI
jgi:hypothetical protein